MFKRTGFSVKSQSALAHSDEKSDSECEVEDPGTSPPSCLFTTTLRVESRSKLKKDHTIGQPESTKDSSNKIVLEKIMARPPGTYFLGSRSTTVSAHIGKDNLDSTPVTIDSGSDITLISEKCLSSLFNPPKVRSGQRVNLVQVTGKSSINGYVVTPLIFHTSEGPVEISIEAYVVKGMSVPFILGNDFASQYRLSLNREEQGTFVILGNSGRKIQAQESSTVPRTDDAGNVFHILTRPDFKTNLERYAYKRKQSSKQRKLRVLGMNEQFTPVKLSRPVILKPASTRSVPIQTSFNSDQEEGFIERSLATNLGNNDLYGIADSLIAKSYPYIQMSHFSQRFVKLPKGHVIGHMTDPKKGLNYVHDICKEDLQAGQVKAKLINALAVEEPPPEIS